MKKLSFITVLIAFSILIYQPLFAEENCNIPYLHDEGYGSYYDARYGVKGFPAPHPNGGWKIYIVFEFEDEKGRQVADLIKSVEFENSGTGVDVILTKPLIAPSYPMIEYAITLGRKENLLGEWTMTVKMKKGKYVRSFNVTEDMLNLERPSMAEDLVIEEYDDTNFIVRHAAVLGEPLPNWIDENRFCFYRLRVFDENGYRIYQDDGRYDDSTDDIIFYIPKQYAGREARIEFRYFYHESVLPRYCCGYGECNMLRSCLYFIVGPYLQQ